MYIIIYTYHYISYSLTYHQIAHDYTNIISLDPPLLLIHPKKNPHISNCFFEETNCTPQDLVSTTPRGHSLTVG